MKVNKITQSLNAGELSPLMGSRNDQQKYASGCKTMENAIPLIYGGAQKRPGLEYINSAISSTAADKSRLVGFEHSVDDTYVLEFGNQELRFFKDGDRVYQPLTTEDLSGHSANLKAHWKMADDADSSVVLDETATSHDGALYDSANATGGAGQYTSTIMTTNDASTADTAFDMTALAAGGTSMIVVPNSDDFTYGDGSDDSAFTLLAVVNYTSDGTRQDIVTKWETNTREWALYVDTDDKLVFKLFDESVEEAASIKANSTLSSGWAFVAATYSPSTGETAASGMNLYVDWAEVSVTTSNNANYVAMENLAADVIIGGKNGTDQHVITYDEGLSTIIGDMTDAAGIAKAFDNTTNYGQAAGAGKDSLAVGAEGYAGKDWGENNERIVSGFKVWGSFDNGFRDWGSASVVTATLYGSQNNSDWTSLGSNTVANSAGATIEKTDCTATAYRYHRLGVKYASGATDNLNVSEVQFYETGGSTWAGDLDNFAVLDKALSSTEITELVSASTTTPLSITTPYLTADLFNLKFEQSADVTFITHPSYEPRKLSRLSDTSWTLAEAGLQTGPFRDQNTDTTQTITASATSGNGITLTAIGHTPFVTGTTAGHEPSGALGTSKSLTGALFKLVHSSATPSIVQDLAVAGANTTDTLSVKKGVTWDFVTNGTWGTGGDPASIVLERSYDEGSSYETVHTIVSAANKNSITSGTEDVADALYRARVAETGGASTANIHISIRDTSIDGLVEITSVTSGTIATGNVLTTLGSTDATHRWAEGSFSNRRGWPIDVTISSEERLTFAGTTSEPLTVWGSTVGDFTDFADGTDDDSPVQFTLVGSGQQNRIRWMIAKDALILGTNGGEHLLGASKDEEALTPTNVKAKLQTTYGSEDVAAKIVNQAVLFVQRGGKKVREFLYNFEADAHKADDLTVFAEHITGDGIVDTAFQRTPDPILWCVRTDGQIAILSYERDQNVFSWSRLFTSTKDGTADSVKSVIESVAVIYGGTRSEDEVWVSILRQIDSNGSRTIERFSARNLPSDEEDYKFVDSYITDTGGVVAISGLDHLEGETVQVYGDGLVQATKEVSGGAIEADTAADKYQVGLGYTTKIVPMDIDIEGTGLTTTKRINRAILNFYETIGGTVGPDTTRQEDIPTGTSLFTGHKEVSIPGGYSRDTDITFIHNEPTPATLLSISYDLGASKD